MKEALIYGMTQGGLETEMDLSDLFGLWVD